MNVLEHQLDYPFADVPQAGRAPDVAPGVRWIRMPLPRICICCGWTGH